MNERAGRPAIAVDRCARRCTPARILLILRARLFRTVPPTVEAPRSEEGENEPSADPVDRPLGVVLIVVLLLLRSYFLPEKYAVIWLLAAVVAIVLSVFPGS